MLRLILLLFLFVASVHGNSDDIVWMNVEWVLQGHFLQFDGFFAEVLGFASEFRLRFPLARLTKSLYKESLNENQFKDRDKLMNFDLTAGERSAIAGLTSKSYPAHEKIGGPVSSIFSTRELEFSSVCTNVSYTPSVSLETALAKYVADDVVDINAGQCCDLCRLHPGCVSWSYHADDKKCALHRSAVVPNATSSEHQTVAYGNFPFAQRLPKPSAFVFHGTICSVNNRSVVAMQPRDLNSIYIGRYMVERADFTSGITLDEYAVTSCMQHMDEIWVPTEWHRDVFSQIFKKFGVRGPIISIVPEAVDTTFFSPTQQAAVTYLAVPMSGADASLEVSGEVQSHVSAEPSVFYVKDPAIHGACGLVEGQRVVCHGGKTSFDFLSVFKWERRKGWDLLLRAYWTAFSAEDHVCLRLRTYIPSFDKNRTPVIERIRAFALQEFGTSDLSTLARVQLESDTLGSDALTRAQLRDLYSNADAFVLPSRGEGWGLPVAEAMSMAVPVVVSACPGVTAYATADNTYLVPVESQLDELSFVQVRVDKLAEAMRKVVSESSSSGEYKAQRKAALARKTMSQFNLSAEYIVNLIADRLRFHASRRGWTY